MPDTAPEVLSWLRGAGDINAGVGAFSDFVRGYTFAQHVARFGEAPPTSRPGSIQSASDLIATEVLGEIIDTGEIPSLQTIAEKDAEPAAATLFRNDPSGWAGNPLFLGLGFSSPLYGNVLSPSGDTYDVLAMVKFTLSTTFNPDWSALTTALQSLGHLGVIAAAYNDTAAFIDDAYGPGLPALPFLGDRILLGRVEEGDVINGGANDDVIHGGGGEDTLSGGGGANLLDGGAGLDAVSYNQAAAITAHILNDGALTARLAARVTGGDVDDKIFNVETIVGSSNDDNFVVHAVSSAQAPLTLLAGGGEDTLDIAELNGAIIDTRVGQLVAAGGSVAIQGFEVFRGGDGNDVFLLDQLATSVDAGGGDDVIGLLAPGVVVDGGAGVDAITFQDATSAVTFDLSSSTNVEALHGSAFSDTLAGARFAFGREGDDTIFGTDLLGTEEAPDGDSLSGGAGDDRILGGAGDDTLSGDEGDDVVLGGEGNDLVYALHGHDTVMGGDGYDTIFLTSEFQGVVDGGDGGAGITFELASVGMSYSDAATPYQNVSSVTLTNYGDSLYLTTEDSTDYILGGGNDYVSIATWANNRLDLGLGADTVAFDLDVSGGVYIEDGEAGDVLWDATLGQNFSYVIEHATRRDTYVGGQAWFIQGDVPYNMSLSIQVDETGGASISYSWEPDGTEGEGRSVSIMVGSFESGDFGLSL